MPEYNWPEHVDYDATDVIPEFYRQSEVPPYLPPDLDPPPPEPGEGEQKTFAPDFNPPMGPDVFQKPYPVPESMLEPYLGHEHPSEHFDHHKLDPHLGHEHPSDHFGHHLLDPHIPDIPGGGALPPPNVPQPVAEATAPPSVAVPEFGPPPQLLPTEVPQLPPSSLPMGTATDSPSVAIPAPPGEPDLSALPQAPTGPGAVEVPNLSEPTPPAFETPTLPQEAQQIQEQQPPVGGQYWSPNFPQFMPFGPSAPNMAMSGHIESPQYAEPHLEIPQPTQIPTPPEPQAPPVSAPPMEAQQTLMEEIAEMKSMVSQMGQQNLHTAALQQAFQPPIPGGIPQDWSGNHRLPGEPSLNFGQGMQAAFGSQPMPGKSGWMGRMVSSFRNRAANEGD